MMYRLIVLNGAAAGQRWTIPTNGAVIGRAADCTVQLADPEAAARHAVVEFEDDALRIRDLGSMNRILVNRREVREAKLKHGDTIEIGLTRLLVEAHVQAEVAEASGPRARRRPSRAALAAAAIVLVSLIALAVRGSRSRPSAPPKTQSAEKVAPAPTPTPAPAPPPPPVAELPPPPSPEPPATVAEPPSPPVVSPSAAAPDLSPISEEMRRLREDLASLREAVAERTPPGAEPPAAPPPPDPALRMIEQARVEIAAGRLSEAEKLLDGILVLDPNRTEALAERAAIEERRGLIKRAIERWRKMAEGDFPESDRRRAAQELRRLRAVEAERAAGESGIRLADLRLVKFVAPEGVAELRTVHARLERAADAPPPDPDDIELEVFFYERDVETGAVELSSAVAPQTVRLEGPWTDAAPRSIIAAYRVPLEGRPGEGSARVFHGYVARLRVRGRVVEQRARPPDLAALAPEDTP